MKTLKEYIRNFSKIPQIIYQLWTFSPINRAWMIPIFISLIGFYSCDWESEIEIDDMEIPSRLVMNSIVFLESDTNRLYFSNSKSIFSAENARKALKYDNSYYTYWYADPTVYYLPDVETKLLKNGVQQTGIFTDPKDSITYYTDNQIKSGDQFFIEANQDGRKITASTTIPARPEILGVDTMRFLLRDQSHSYSYSGEQLRLLVKIKDDPATKNYYRIFVDKKTIVCLDPEYANFHDIPDTIVSYFSHVSSDDPAITNGNPKNIENSDIVSTEFQQNYYNIFTDELFQNGEYILNVYTPTVTYNNGYMGFYYDSKYIIYQKETLTIRLQAISPELYQYYNSLQKFLYNNDDVIEPFRVYNNVEGGLGIFGSINQLKYVVYENETTK